MGMDVFGKNPASEQGAYFRNNWWWWRPVAYYICEVAPDIASRCEHWQSNDGDGLEENDCVELAGFLQREIDSGRTAVWVELYLQTREGDELRYFASVENMQDFVNFLRDCGGFSLC